MSEELYDTCPDCGALAYGNLTCETCRWYMRVTHRCPSELLDALDAANVETVPPVTREEILQFLERLK